MVFFTCASAQIAQVSETRVLFGGKSEWMEIEAFRKEIGADEVVQWNGVTHLSKQFGGAGTLDDQQTGARITAPVSKVQLTTTGISSSAPSRSHTVQEGFQLGVNAPKSKQANFEETDDCSWSFKFDREVRLHMLMFNGIDHGADTITLTTPQDGKIVLRGKTIFGKTKDWSGIPTTRFKKFEPALTIPAGSQITLSASGSEQPSLNRFGLAGILISSY